MINMNPYKVLGLEENADKQAISEAYRDLARQHHPDRGGDVEKFKEATEAYSILSDDNKRHQYHNPHQQARGFNFADMFGGGHSPFAQFFGQRPQQRQVKKHTEDSDIKFKLGVTLDQIKQGASQTIQYTRNKICTHCKGEGAESKTACHTCGGQGVVMVQPNPNTIHQISCHSCGGRGVILINPCTKCQTNGFIQYSEHVTIKVQEEK